MKNVLIVLICVLNLNCGGQSQENMRKYFTKESVNCDFQNNEAKKYCKLIFANDSNTVLKCNYFFTLVITVIWKKLK